MAVTTNRQRLASGEYADVEDWLEVLRYRVLWFGQIALFVAALLVADSVALFAMPVYSVVMALLLIVLFGLVRLLHDRSSRIAAWVFVTGCVGLNALAIAWGAPDQLLWLLTLPVGFAVLTSGVGAGVGVAVVTSVFLLWAPFDVVAVEPQLRNVAVLGMWGVTGLLWLALNSLLGTVQWAWSHYTQNHALLEEARDRQLELHQALDDLSATSQQLARMHRLAQELRQVADNERRAKEEFVAKVSHELRTPLNMIIGFSEMMTQSPQTYGGEIAQSLLSDLNVVLRNSQHLSALIDDVLDLSQIEAGTPPYAHPDIHRLFCSGVGHNVLQVGTAMPETPPHGTGMPAVPGWQVRAVAPLHVAALNDAGGSVTIDADAGYEDVDRWQRTATWTAEQLLVDDDVRLVEGVREKLLFRWRLGTDQPVEIQGADRCWTITWADAQITLTASAAISVTWQTLPDCTRHKVPADGDPDFPHTCLVICTCDAVDAFTLATHVAPTGAEASGKLNQFP